MSAFKVPEDIANRALQHCGASRIVTLQDNDKGAAEITQCYDGLRRAELRRNLWSFSVRRTVLYPINTPTFNSGQANVPAPTQLLVPATWSAGIQYAFGAIVAWNGAYWVNNATVSAGSQPGLNASSNWDTYFGSLCVNPWVDPTVPANANFSIGYFVGDLLYIGSQVFISLINGNTAGPLTPTPWSVTGSYSIGQVVADEQGWLWKSAVNNNIALEPGVYGGWSAVPNYTIGAMVIGSDAVLYEAISGGSNHNPANGAAPSFWTALGTPGSWPLWGANLTYAQNDFVAGLDGLVYQSVQNSNTNHNPVGSVFNPNTPATNWWVATGKKVSWISNFATSVSSLTWLGSDARMDNLNFNYPIGTGPSVQTQTKNVFMLPNGFLRTAPQEPKAGSVSFLGAPTGRMYDDWEIDGNFLISQTPYPIVYRFGADITIVAKMDDMFCEGLGCRVAEAVCETLTQSREKITVIMQDYKKFMDDARTTNGIEQGATEPPEDDYITCRI